jgi:hypothetical protein
VAKHLVIICLATWKPHEHSPHFMFSDTVISLTSHVINGDNSHLHSFTQFIEVFTPSPFSQRKQTTDTTLAMKFEFRNTGSRSFH